MTERVEKFTPGPWKLDGCEVQIPQMNGRLPTMEERLANAALIAATPEMYDWQDDALEVMRCILQDQYTPYSIRKELEPLIERGEAIQKKARGEK